MKNWRGQRVVEGDFPRKRSSFIFGKAKYDTLNLPCHIGFLLNKLKIHDPAKLLVLNVLAVVEEGCQGLVNVVRSEIFFDGNNKKVCTFI